MIIEYASEPKHDPSNVKRIKELSCRSASRPHADLRASSPFPFLPPLESDCSLPEQFLICSIRGLRFQKKRRRIDFKAHPGPQIYCIRFTLDLNVGVTIPAGKLGHTLRPAEDIVVNLDVLSCAPFAPVKSLNGRTEWASFL